MKRFAIAICLAVLAAPVFGQEADPEKLQFELTPYFLFAGLKGDVSPDGLPVEVPLDIPFSDVFNNLDGAFAIVGEGRKGPFGAGAGYMFMDVSAEEEQEVVTTLASAKLSLWDIWGFYSWPLSETGSRVDVMAGTRIYSVEGGGGLGVMDTSFTTLGKASWVDAIVGLRLVGQITPRLSVNATGDYGFVGSDGSLHGLAMINYRAIDLLSIRLGYRILSMNYEDGEQPLGYRWDVTAQGPLAALTFHF